MTMESQSRDASPCHSPGGISSTADTPKPVSPQLPTPAVATEPPKKRPAFSISSILGEDDKPQTKIARSSVVSPTGSIGSNHEEAVLHQNKDRSSPLDVERHDDASPHLHAKSPINIHPTNAPSPRMQLPPLGPQEAAKYNAFLAAAHLSSNPDMAKLYRWPLLWGPWMGGIPAAGFPPAGLPRPPLLQHNPVAALAAQEGLRQSNRSESEAVKESLEAGEIVRPLACRRPPVIHDHPSPPKNHFPHHPHHLPLNSDPRQQLQAGKQSPNSTPRSPSPPGQRGHPLSGPGPLAFPPRGHMVGGPLDALKLNNGTTHSSVDNKHFCFDSEDKDNDMVEIEIDEDVSDGEGNNGSSRDDDDVLNKSNCERKKKTRTVFSRSQIFQLETMFDMKRYLSSSERAGLAKALNMTETQVKIWFQNRRNKWKRQIAAEMEAANMSQVTGQRLMQLPYMYSHDELSRGMRSPGNMPPISSLPPSAHPVVPPSVHHYYGNMLRAHTS